MLACLSRTITPADYVKALEGSSSGWLKDEGLPGFGWQNGYGAFSVSYRELPSVREYIERQDQHHLTRAFEEEYLGLLVEHGVEYDLRYVWD